MANYCYHLVLLLFGVSCVCVRNTLSEAIISGRPHQRYAHPNKTASVKETFARFFRIHSPFVPDGTNNSKCLRQSERFLRDLQNLELWAVKMYDSSGKLQAGLLNGNVHSMGDYWQCLGIDENLPGTLQDGGGEIKGKYCQVDAYVEVLDGPELTNIMELVFSHRAVQNTYDDGVKFFPTFTPITWGFCVPSSCDHQDVTRQVSSILEPFNHSSGLVIRLKSDQDSCNVHVESKFHSGTAFPTIVLLYTIVGVVLVGTALDLWIPDLQNRGSRHMGLLHRICLSFSLPRNWKHLTNVSTASDDIGCVHGIRFIFSLAIYFLHRGVFGMFVPFSNRTAIAKNLEGDWTMIFRAFWNNVDSFVVLSGLLTSYYSVKKLQSGQRLDILFMYCQRYYKFTPMFAITLLIIRNVAVELRAGPNAIRVVKHFVVSCQESSFWKNLLYLGNLDGMNNMCYPPSHQLITDMQMYLISPFVVLLMWRFRKQAITSLGVVVLFLTIYKGVSILRFNMGSFIYYGASLSDMLVSANQMYLNPLHRLTPYLFGVGLGFYMRTTGKHIKLTMEQINFGWCAATIAAFYSFFGPRHAARRDYKFDVHESAVFGMLQPVLWSSALCWTIFACSTGRGGVLNRFLSWKGFVIFTKLSYSFYLTQILVIFWGISGAMAPEYMRMHQIIDLNEMLFVVLMSLLFSLTLLLPLAELHQTVFRTSDPGLLQESTPRLDKSEFFSSQLNFQKLPLELSSLEMKKR